MNQPQPQPRSCPVCFESGPRCKCAPLQLTLEQVQDHSRDYDGFCTFCNAVTRWGDTEPDAENYECPECEAQSCFGIEQAVIMGLIEITDGGAS